MIKEIVKKIQPIDEEFVKKGRSRTENLIIPYRAMGLLNDISEQLCGIYRTCDIEIERGAVFVMAGDHGVVEEGVSAFPQVVTCEMIKAFLNGEGVISVLAKKEECKVVVCDIGTKCQFQNITSSYGDFVSKKVVHGTKNFLKDLAMTRSEAENSIIAGFELADEYILKHKLQIVATGDMGIGNTTPSSAIGVVFTGESADKMTGRGTVIDDATLYKKIKIIETAINIHMPNKNDPIDVLSKVGGAEIGGIAGVILAAAKNRVPVIIDGLISTAGALIAYNLNKNVSDYIFAGHISQEPGHKIMLKYLAKKPILDLDLRLGEGSGAVLAMSIVKQAANMFCNVSTFDKAKVSR